MKQWHPVFVEILRPWLEGYYEVLANVPVGDVPREADVVLLHRLDAGSPPFQGIWKNLVTWNVVEFKGPTVSVRTKDLDLLIELGLGIERRLNEEHAKVGKKRVSAMDVAFWYLANNVSSKFAAEWDRKVCGLALIQRGMWRGLVLDHPLFLVSRRDVPVEPDSIALHMIAKESRATENELLQLLLNEETLWSQFSEWLVFCHPELLKRAREMAVTKGFKVNFRPLIENFGDDLLKELLPALSRGLKERRVSRVERDFVKQALRSLAPEELVAGLTREQIRVLKKLLK